MPHPFFFGAATSSHQVEGGTHNNWSEWEKKNAKRLAREAREHPPKGGWSKFLLDLSPGPLDEKNYISGRASDHYTRFREDFDIARSLGHNAHRFSIEWSRIEPREGAFDEKEIEHYREVIRALRERNLEPFVTLWHWTMPVWLMAQGGVLSKEFPVHFKRYVKKVAGALGPDVRFWITLNEPEIFSSFSYYRGEWPPQKKNIFLLFKSIHNLVHAHHAAYAVIKNADPDSQVGPVIDLVHFESAGGIWNASLKRLADYLWNSYFFVRVKAKSDFIGLNYYLRSRISRGFNRNANETLSDMGWEIYPEGIYHILKELKKYKMPVYVTENGIADVRDIYRAGFLKDHIYAVRKAMDEGVDVRGYFHWSLLDNFEWSKGFWPRFGLVEVDYRTFARTVRPSAIEYKKLIKEWHERKQ